MKPFVINSLGPVHSWPADFYGLKKKIRELANDLDKLVTINGEYYNSRNYQLSVDKES